MKYRFIFDRHVRYSVVLQCDVLEVSQAPEQAIARRDLKAGMILHSDRGVQYSSDAYRSIITKHGFRQSMSRKGDCWDNAPMEPWDNLGLR